MARALAVLLLTGGLMGCGLFGGAGVETPEQRHVVFLTQPGCRWFVAQTQEARFSVLAPSTDFAPRRGDVLLGNLQAGARSLRVVPFPGHQVAGAIPFNVAGTGLSLPDAQALWRETCPDLSGRPVPGGV